MKPAPFDYHAPATLEDALALLAQLGEEANLLAGGQTLVPLLNMRMALPAALIDLNGIDELSGIELAGSELRIGAMTRHMTFETDATVRRHVPLLAETARHIAHVQIRTRGTIGGSLSSAVAAAEWPAAMAALDARLIVRSASRGERTLSTAEFFAGAMMTSLAADEIVVAVHVPVPAAETGWAFVEFARRSGDFALAGAATLVTLDADGAIASARLALCGMAEPGLRLSDVEASLIGARPTEEVFDKFERQVRDTVEAPADVQLSAQSRREVAGVIARRSLAQAIGRCGAGAEA